jgi:hypothetical protein
LQLVVQDVTTAVSSNDAVNFPEAKLIEKLMSADAYLANDQLVDVVGGYAFFGFLMTRLPSGCFGSPTGIL